MIRLSLLVLAACSTGVKGETAAPTTTSPSETGTPGTTDTEPAEVGVAALGGGTHDLAAVEVTEIATSADGLAVPRDLEFSPYVDGELWVVNRADDSVTIVSDAGSDSQSSKHIIDPYALHFMEEVSSISFGSAEHEASDYPNFGTCQESRNSYNDLAPPNNFMGPTLWSSDPDIFGITNDEAVDYLSNLYGFYVDLGSHLDMLHESPDCMGIAWETANVYWVFDGFNGVIARYDFADDHGVGYDDHSDGIISKYVDAPVTRVEDVPSHMVFDQDSALLYVADTGGNRIAALDTTTGERGAQLSVWEWGTDHHEVVGSDFFTVIDGAEHGLEQPSGLALVDDLLLVGDYATGILYAFDLEGELVDWVDTGLGAGALMGIEARGTDDVWIVDASADTVLRLQPR